MSDRKAYACMLLAALLIAAAGPALAKSQQKQQQSGSSTQSASTKAEQECNRVTPPFMYNPRFMNRGFFKANKCRKLKNQ